jgi:phosphoglycerate dehydrogenase-like enzyme
MKQGATFINTSRGAVVDEPEMIEVLKARPDLIAVLDVTHPEPPAQDSPLRWMENVVLTPHIAGSMGRECQRMGIIMVQELERYLSGISLHYEIDSQRATILA